MSNGSEEAQRRMWTIGDYPTVAEHLLPISVETVGTVGVRPGDRVLDVGVGTANAAIEAARLGADVTGIDLTPAQIERARARCEAEGVDIELRVGDAERLDVGDASFDSVISVMGMIFAPDHARAIAEMARASRAGGTVAVTAWAPGGWSTEWREVVAPLLPPAPSGGPWPDEWGDRDEARRRFAAAGLDPIIEVRPFAWRFPSVAVGVDVFLTAAGPFVAMMESASAAGCGDEVRRELAAAMEQANQADDGTCELPAPYLLAMARKG